MAEFRPPLPMVEEPTRRSVLRRSLGREYYILGRRLVDARSGAVWVKRPVPAAVRRLPYVISEHSSPTRRPLLGVEPVLQENKRVNLSLACARIDGVVLEPGDTFSLWRLVGRPTRAKGYVEGLVLDQGEVGTGIGGGLCQLSNLLFWLIANSGLDITERHRHTFDVFPDVNRTVPFGAGATVSYNYIDLRFTNRTSTRYQIELDVGPDRLSALLSAEAAEPYRYEVAEVGHRFEQQFWGGYSRHNRIVRRTMSQDQVIEEKVLAINDALVRYSPVLDPG